MITTHGAERGGNESGSKQTKVNDLHIYKQTISSRAMIITKHPLSYLLISP